MTKPTTIFQRWVERDAYGDDFTYHTDGRERNAALFEYAAKLSDAGLVLLWQRRTPDGNGFDHVARRTSVAASAFVDKVSASVKTRRRPKRDDFLGAYVPGMPALGREHCLDYSGD